MDSRHRDGLLAVVGLGVLLAGGVAIVGTGPLLHPGVVAVGVVGALCLEVAFVRYAERLLPLWERPGVPVASLLTVLGVGAISLRYAPRLAGALVWGLATYLVFLVFVLAGLWEPSRRRSEDR